MAAGEEKGKKYVRFDRVRPYEETAHVRHTELTIYRLVPVSASVAEICLCPPFNGLFFLSFFFSIEPRILLLPVPQNKPVIFFSLAFINS